MTRQLQLLAAVTAGIAVFLVAVPAHGQGTQVGQNGVEAQVRAVEEQFRVAKLENDVDTLERILDEAFFATNQNGNSRNKGEMIDLFRTFPIESLSTDPFTVRLRGDVAVVTGSQTQVRRSRTDRLLFTRVYIKNETEWQLLSVTQFMNPTLQQRRTSR